MAENLDYLAAIKLCDGGTEDDLTLLTQLLQGSNPGAPECSPRLCLEQCTQWPINVDFLSDICAL